jgi:hypothetical protein
MRLLLAFCLLGCAPLEQLPMGSASNDCGSCHEDHYRDWQSSAHAQSVSPLLQAMLPEVEAQWGSFARSQCEGCHAPSHGDDEAIGCVSCHSAIGNHGERDGLLTVDLAAPISGPFADAEPTPAHASRVYGFLPSESLCGTCHEITGPNLVREPTLTEFRASPQAAAGQTCIDCHAPRREVRPLVPDGRLRPTRSHRFSGFDAELLASALALRAERRGEILEVVLTNTGAGHSVPTGAAFLRDIWVDVEVDGMVIAPSILRIGDQPTHAGVPVPLLTRADAVRIGSLAPGAEVRASIAAPPGATVILRARPARIEVLQALDRIDLAGAPIEVASIEM